MPENTPSAVSTLRSLRRQARRALWLEQAWRPLRLPGLMIGLYGLSSLARLPQSLSDWLHAIVEASVIGGAAWLAVRGLHRIERPTDMAVDRRIERDSRLAYQPLMTLSDRPVAIGAGIVGADTPNLLWDHHVRRVLSALPKLRVSLPKPDMTRPEAIAATAVPVTLIAAALIAGPHTLSRFHAGFMPGVDDDSVPLPQVQAWIDRPAYASGAPVFLSPGFQSGLIVIPQGAVLTATITAATGRPIVSGLTHATPSRLDAESWNVHGTLDESGTITLRMRGRTLGAWRVTVQPDLPPTVKWAGKPGVEKDDWRTSLPWEVHQTYGVSSLEVEITGKGSLHVLHVPVPLNGQPKDAKGTARPDLSSDAFAGMTVQGRLHARSLSGRESYSNTMTFRLGARKFVDPLARALIGLRHRLITGQERTSQAREELDLLSLTTNDRLVLAPLGLIIASLQPYASENTTLRTPGLLWALALYLDDLRRDGPEIADAAAEVRAAQDDVQQQLDHMHDLGEKGQTLEEQAELQRRTQALKDALNRRMQLLFRRAAASGIVMPPSDQETPDPWSDALRRLQSDAAQGHGDEALRRLQQMEDMAEHMRQATPQDLKALAAQMKAQQEARAQRAALHDLIHREAGLLDHTQARLTAARKAAASLPGQQDDGRDISRMSTADLMRQLGIQPPPDMPDGQKEQPAPPLDAATVAAQSDQRRKDHAVQHALRQSDIVLDRRVEALTGKEAKALSKAQEDMKSARKALADRHDVEAQTAEEKVLADLQEAGKEMRQNQKSSSSSSSGGGGGLSFIPAMGSGGHGDQQKKAGGEKNDDEGDQPQAGDDDGSDDDQQKNKDPLGRKLGEGNDGKDSDAHIPDKSTRDRARDIERELRRRAADRTRPPGELDYLERLLKSF